MDREPHIPGTKNALSLEIRAELIELFRKIGDDASVKVVVLTGSGNAFCSGGGNLFLSQAFCDWARPMP